MTTANRYEVRVESIDRDGSIAWLRLDGGRLAARPWPGLARGRAATVTVRPEDVVLCQAHPGLTSARNVLPGHVRSVRKTPEGIHVALDVGFPLVALVTGSARRDLELRRGREIYALVKATTIAPEFDLSPGVRIRVTLVGDRGQLAPDQIDLLRTIDRTGSLSAAARELRVTFRTVWNRARAIHRAWGHPLVERAPGGSGSTLTAEGTAVLRMAAAIEGESIHPHAR